MDELDLAVLEEPVASLLFFFHPLVCALLCMRWRGKVTYLRGETSGHGFPGTRGEGVPGGIFDDLEEGFRVADEIGIVSLVFGARMEYLGYLSDDGGGRGRGNNALLGELLRHGFKGVEHV